MQEEVLKYCDCGSSFVYEPSMDIEVERTDLDKSIEVLSSASHELLAQSRRKTASAVRSL
jgi:hypothetical protein